MLARRLRQFLFKREGKRLPFMAPPLRQAGQGAQERVDDFLTSIGLAFGAILAFAIMAGWTWVQLSWGEPWPMWLVRGGVSFVMWVLVTLGILLWIRRARIRFADYHLGWMAERVVGEALEQCKSDLPFVFHDVVEEKINGQFNIDHVAIGEAGVFVFETKGKRKPEKGDVTISFDGSKLRFADGSYTDDPIRQVKANARRIKERLSELLREKRNAKFQFRPDRPLPITPVLAYPGWTVKFHDFRNTDFNVVTEKTLAGFIAKRPRALTPEEVTDLGQLLGNSLKKERRHVLDDGAKRPPR